MHYLYLDDDNGELVDAIPLCSDSCSRDLCKREGIEYPGWNGAHETEFTTYCANCGVVIGGIDPASEGIDPDCDHVYLTVVNRIGLPEEEYCEHGTMTRAKVERFEEMSR